MTAVDVASVLAGDWPTPSYRAALMVLSTTHKTIPAQPPADGEDPFYVDWDALEEEMGPWSTTEQIRVRLARSLADGDLNDAAWSLDARNWQTLLDALAVAREGR